jgi:hypothetical protein
MHVAALWAGLGRILAQGTHGSLRPLRARLAAALLGP